MQISQQLVQRLPRPWMNVIQVSVRIDVLLARAAREGVPSDAAGLVVLADRWLVDIRSQFVHPGSQASSHIAEWK